MTMNIIKCKLCREPFHSYGCPICPACSEQVDKDFFTVRDYIEAHPGQAKAEKIAEDTGVKEAHIVYLLEEGRLDTSSGLAGSGMGGNMKCQVCGRPISIGNLCDSCKSALTKELGVNNQANSQAKGGSYVSPRSSRSGS